VNAQRTEYIRVGSCLPLLVGTGLWNESKKAAPGLPFSMINPIPGANVACIKPEQNPRYWRHTP